MTNSDTHAGPPPTILIVDDEQEIIVALEDLLGDDYRLLSTTSPRAALEMLRTERNVAVIISDQRMPEMTGDRLLAEAQELSDAETLLLTGYADLDAVIGAINRGRIGGYANKPWAAEALLAMVAAAAERWRLKRALAFEHAAFTALTGSSSDHVLVLAPDGHAVRGSGEADGRDRAVLDAGKAEDEEEERAEGGDGRRWTRVQRIPFEVEGGGRHLLRIESDQTQRRMLEARLHQSEKLQALGTLAGGIAHDFNNLLTAVLGNLELAERRAEDGRLRRFIDNAAEAARRGTALTQRLLSFSRQRDLAAVVVDVNALVAGIEHLIVRTMGGLVTLELALAADAWRTRVDADQLELALLNLCINARDAMPDGGAIRLSTTSREVVDRGAEGLAPGSYVGIMVADTGCGMSADVAARAFEPFFTTKAPGRGTGLGLPMVYAMARAVGGGVQIESAEGTGTTVTIWLPRTDEPLPTGRTPTDMQAADMRRLSILVVEDDPEVRAVTRAHLDELGHDHVAVEGGAEAIARLDAGASVDVVITDFAMPGMSGIELARAVAMSRPGTPVILVTGFAETVEVPEHVTLLPKPFTQGELAGRLAAVTDARR